NLLGGKVAARGSLRPGEPFALDADFEGTDLAVDGSLRPAAERDATALEILEALVPSGRVDLQGRISRRGRSWDGAVEAAFRDLSLRCDGFRDHESGKVYGFAYPARIANGLLSLAPAGVWIHHATGTMGPATVSIDGDL